RSSRRACASRPTPIRRHECSRRKTKIRAHNERISERCCTPAELRLDSGVKYVTVSRRPVAHPSCEGSLMNRVLFGALLVGFWSLPSRPAPAADKDKKPHPAGIAELLRSSPDEFIKRFDKNKDGVL